MNRIDSYRFGEIVVNGKTYSSDVIIFPDRIEDNWHRKSGHQLCLEDMTEIIAETPKVVVVGTGAAGFMQVLSEVPQIARAQGIELITEPTDNACNTYNRLSPAHTSVIAALHLTC